MRTGYRRLCAGLVASAVMGAVLPQAAVARTAERRPSAQTAAEGERPPDSPRIPRTPPRKYPVNSADPKVTYGAGGTVIDAPTVVHGTGAELSWRTFADGSGRGDDLVGYQLHRSTRPDFKVTGATLVAPLGKNVTSYTDTTAEPTPAGSAQETARRYSYRLLAETRDGRLLASPVRRVGVPKAGHTLRILRAGRSGTTSDTTLSSAEPGANLDGKWLSVGADDGTRGAARGTTRAALKFPLRGIPKKATVLQADLRLRTATDAATDTKGRGRLVELSPLQREFAEKSASWRRPGAGTPWRAGGGDAAAAVSDTTGRHGTYAWDVTSLTRTWLKHPSANKGVLLRAAGEKNGRSTTRQGTVHFASSEAPDEARRPEIRVIVAEPTPWDTYYAPDTPARMSENNTYPVDVTVTNTTTEAWPADQRALSYKWALPDGTDATTAANQLKADIPALAPGASATVEATVRSPFTADGNRRSGYTLTWDILNKADDSWLSQKPGIGGLPQTTSVEDPTADRVGLEKQHAYTGKNTGAGSTLMNNLGSGNAVWSYNAFSNPGRGINTFARLTYNAQDTSDSQLGHGWSGQAAGPLRLGAMLDFHPDADPGEAYVIDGDGTQHLFRKQGDGSWQPSAGYHYRLTAKPDVTSVCRTGTSPEVPDAWTLTRPDGTRFVIGCDGYLTSIVDKNGNTQTYVYELRDAGNRRVKFLTEVKDPAARTSLKVAYYRAGDATYDYIDDKGDKAAGKDLWNPRIYDHVKSMTDVSGRRISFHYTTKGLLGRLTDGDGAAQPKVFSFAYDTAQGNRNTKLTKVTDPRGHATDVEYGDGPEGGWSTKTITDRKRAATAFAYASATGGGTETKVTDAEQHTTTYETDGQDRPVKITNAKSEQTRMTWDGDHNVTLLEEDNGPKTARTAFCYDEKTGYPLWERLAEENKEGLPSAADCAPGKFPPHSVRYEYKTRADGYAVDLVGKTSAENRTWRFGHDAKGNLKTVTDPKGVASAEDGDYTTSYEYDAYGQLTRATDANGNPTAYKDFVATGYPRTTTDALAKVTTTEYDVRGQVTEVRDALGKKTTRTYDAFGRPLVSKAPKDQAAGVYITTPAPEYDANDNVTVSTAPNGAVSKATYDEADQVVSATAPKDTATSAERRTAYTYDAVGNLRTTTEPKGTATPSDPDDYVTTNNYDEVYQLTSVVNAKKEKVGYVHDGAGNTVRVIDPKKSATPDPDDYTTKTDYDMNHRVVAVSDATGRTVKQSFDKDSLVVSTTDQEDNKTVNHYDERGKLAVVEVPHAAGTVRTTKFGYDEVGNRIKVFTPRAVATGAEPDDFVAETTYDALNRPSRQIQPYDPKDPRYNRKVWTETSYDAVGRVEKVSAPPSEGETTRNDTTYGYFDNGWVKTSQDVWDIRTSYDYNDLGQQSARQLTSAGGSTSRTMRWGFYPDGKLKSRDDDGIPVGANELVASGAQARTGRGTQVSPHVWKLNVAKAGRYTAYAEGAAGKWTKLGTDTYKKGENAELKAAADTVKLVRDHSADADTERKRFAYAYDVNGNLTSIDDTSTGTKVDAYTMTYTGLNQVDKVVEALAGQEKKATSYTYDANGQPETLKHPDQYAKYTYDLRELVKTVAVGKSATDASPKVTSYDYTWRGERKTETKANKNTVGYDYFLDGALKTQTEKKPDGTTLVASHSYAYDANGNKAQDVAKKMNADDHAKYLSSTTDYTYDPADRLAKSVRTGQGAGTETYVHDDNANVISQTVKGKKTTFGYDRNRLLKTTVDGAAATYTYDAFGRQESVTSGGKIIERNAYDGFDRVKQHEQADTSTGALKATKYAYDPLDRTAKRTDAGGKSTDYTYLGMSGEVLGEEVAGKLTKSYQYGPWGERLSQVKHAADGSAGESAFYGYNGHTDVETLTDKSGDTKATYGYSAYGSDDKSDFTGIDKPDAGNSAKDVYNPYRYNSKRWDAASATYDMGFRDYSPGLNRFTTRDMYNGAAADMRLGADALTGNRYAFTGGNPISNVELDGHLPCVDGIQEACGGGGGGGPALSRGVLADGRSAIYDEYGIGHIVGGAGDNDASKLALKSLNDDLKKAGAFSDGSGKGTGEQFLPQDDTPPLVNGKGSFTDKNGNVRLNGTTSDFIRVSYEAGKIVDVIDFDATSSTDGKEMGLIAKDIDNKMGKKRQANNVVYVAQSADQAKMVAAHYAKDPRVRVLHPSSGFDSAPVFNGATGRAHAGRVSPRIGRAFGFAGFAMPFAQSNSYIRSFGLRRGAVEMGMTFIDPFGVADSVSPPSNSGGVCDPSSGNCA
ncbi:DNRLRE domain-containing protein [Streptomyces sp. NPDC005865]|uniref:DNRLRE domain-containing protein n=1 Tax=Streptomyces sp. NPDC005865 TaxID=3155453 RepID=UPI00340B9808